MYLLLHATFGSLLFLVYVFCFVVGGGGGGWVLSPHTHT